MRHLNALIILLLAFTLANAAVSADEYDIATNGRVVAFGDVHGAYDDWVKLLQETGVIDDGMNWSGGNTHLVSLGDLIDRGPGSRQVVELLMKLQSQAKSAGGAVHMVLGNHEVMVMTGDLRYVSPAEFAAFAADETSAEREALWQDYRRYNPGGDEAAVRAAFDNDYPAGFVALRKAYSLEGQLGSWLVRQPFAIKVNDKVYMHGGISKEASTDSLSTLNDRLKDELMTFLQSMDTLNKAGVMPLHVSYDNRLQFLNARAEEFAAANPRKRAEWFEPLQRVFEAQEAFLFGDDSPNWYRGTAWCHPYSESFNTEQFLVNVGAKQLVVGHTPTRGDVIERMDGLAIRLDTGMLRSHYKGRAAALVSENGQSYVQYLGSPDRMQPVAEPRSLAEASTGMSDAALEEFMRTAPVINVKEVDAGITKPKRITQELSGASHDAVFKYEDTAPRLETRNRYNSRKDNLSDRYIYDVAAYKLDRMLDLQMVPTAVLADVEGDSGALSHWLTDTINERDREAQDIPFTSYCKQWEQYRLRFVFDILIHNDDRNLTNILWTKRDFMLRLIDHSLAFRSTEKRPKRYKKVDVEVSELLRSKLQLLNEQNLTAELGEYLHTKQIEAILARRDLILKESVRPGDQVK